VTLYGDAAARMQAFTGTGNGRNMRVLVVDEQGVVRWSHDRGFSAAKCLELDRLVRSWGQGELAAPTTGPSPTSAVPPSAERTPPALDPTTWTQRHGPTRDGQVGGLISSAVLEIVGLAESPAAMSR
jgi:hypothetical protein